MCIISKTRLTPMDDCVICFWFCVLWYFSVHNAERVQMAGGEGRILEDGGGSWRF